MNYELRQPVDRTLTPLQSVFRNRGMEFKAADIRHYINPDSNDLIELDKIDRIAEGAKLLMKHIATNSKVLLVVDEDCDG